MSHARAVTQFFFFFYTFWFLKIYIRVKLEKAHEMQHHGGSYTNQWSNSFILFESVISLGLVGAKRKKEIIGYYSKFFFFRKKKNVDGGNSSTPWV